VATGLGVVQFTIKQWTPAVFQPMSQSHGNTHITLNLHETLIL